MKPATQFFHIKTLSYESVRQFHFRCSYYFLRAVCTTNVLIGGYGGGEAVFGGGEVVNGFSTKNAMAHETE